MTHDAVSLQERSFVVLAGEPVVEEADYRLVTHISALVAVSQHLYAPVEVGTETVLHIIAWTNGAFGNKCLMTHQHTILKAP